MFKCAIDINFSDLHRQIELNVNSATYWNSLMGLFSDSIKIQSNEEFLIALHTHLDGILNVTNFFVALYDFKFEKYTFPYYFDEKEAQVLSIDVNLNRSLTDYVRRTGEAMLLIDRDIDALIEAGEVDLIGQLANSWMGIPLVVADKKIGVLVIQSYNKNNIYTKDDLIKIIYVSNYVARILDYNNYVYDLKESKRQFLIAQDVSTFGSFEIDIYNDTWWFSEKAREILSVQGKVENNNFRKYRSRLLKNVDFDFDKLFVEFIQQGNKLDFEFEWIPEKSVDYKIIRVRAEKFFINNGRVLKVNGIIQDITEQRNFELKLEVEKEKAEESDTLKTAFLSNMSHEIRTPMNAILGFSDLLTEADISKDETKEYVSLITSSGQVLLKLIDDIIDISKIEANQLEVYKTNVYINVMFKELASVFNILKKEKSKEKLEIIFESDFKDPQFFFYTDEMRLKQVLSNFIANAIKFTKEGFIKCSCLNKGDFLEFRVEDSGIGISDENRSIVFKQFGQILNEGRIYQGTGLGLTISRNLVEILGGEIDFVSEVGKGTTFFFTLPCTKKKI